MQPPFGLEYHPSVQKKDIPRLSHDIQERVRKAIEEKLTKSPQEFGEPLRRTLKGYWKLRVGDYRVIYKIHGRIVLILRIGHRREVYNQQSLD